MAILRDDEDSNQSQGMNQPNQNQQQSDGSQQGASFGAPSGAATQAPNQAQAQQANSQNPKASSGTFTNLRQYITANSGNKVGSSVGQKVSNTASGAQKSIDQGQTAFGQKVDTGSLANRENAVSDISNIIQAARGVTAQPAAPAALATPSADTSTPAALAEAPSYLQGLDSNRFQDVINAQYQGPQSLRQSGLYDPISQKVQTAQTKINQGQTDSGREDLLKDTFGVNRQYTRGQNKLDSLLLNTDKTAVQNLVNQKSLAGNLGQNLQKAEAGSQNLATNRAGEILGIQNQARGTFSQGQTDERQATEDRLAAVVKDWDKLPEQMKQIFRDNPEGAINFSADESALLGVGAGEGFYNLGENAIRTNVADKNKLISRDEQARQFALSQLAGLDQQKRLDTNVLRSDTGAAGTQTSMDALDTIGTRNALNEAQKNFAESAEGATLTGQGHKKVSRGNAWGKKTSNYYATQAGNVADMLKAGGYDVGAEGTSGATSLLQNKDLLNRYLSAVSSDSDSENTIGGKSLEGGAVGASAGTAISPGWGTLIGAVIGSVAGGNTVDPYQLISDQEKQLGEAGIPMMGAMGQGLQDVRSGIGNVIGGAGNMVGGEAGKFIGGIGSAVGGINTGAMAAMGNAVAKENAAADLKNKYEAYLKGQGFENRANVVDNKQTQDRTAALRQLLANMDKTNVG